MARQVPANGLIAAAFGGTTPGQGVNVADITDSGTGTGAAGGTIAAGVGVQTINIQLDLADIADSTLIAAFVMPFKFKILESYFYCTEAATTASKSTVLTLFIGTTGVTNGTNSLTTANCTQGAKVDNAGALAANTGAAAATLKLTAASTTAFGEGKGIYTLVIQNMDTADAFAVLAAQNTAVLSSLEDAGYMATS